MTKILIARLFATRGARALLLVVHKFASGAIGIGNRAYASYLWPDSWQKDFYIYWNCRVKYPDRIAFGKGVRIGPSCVLGAMGGIKMGDHVRLSEGACLETGGLDINGPIPYSHIAKPIVLGEGVWLGFRATVLAGVTIGDRSIVGAGAVVTKDVPPDSIAVGSPARIFPKSKK
ncbi:acyltransferase [Bradyrhizobium ottawaense]|uniref:acyltransferase n=1 Tax=Bradyrhizobium ottawaense TaxID=931866 RepID=UPI0027D561A0|nr:hypothetical protein BwSH14_03340 [Bradyrhizobium ottawaense]GMO70916.1 hypothetical protein BwSH17_28260 [Bradyrhizobium ottawaense]